MQQIKSISLLVLFICLLAPLQPAWADSATVTIGTAASSNGSWSGATPDVWTPGASGVFHRGSKRDHRPSGKQRGNHRCR